MKALQSQKPLPQQLIALLVSRSCGQTKLCANEMSFTDMGIWIAWIFSMLRNSILYILTLFQFPEYQGSSNKLLPRSQRHTKIRVHQNSPWRTNKIIGLTEPGWRFTYDRSMGESEAATLGSLHQHRQWPRDSCAEETFPNSYHLQLLWRRRGHRQVRQNFIDCLSGVARYLGKSPITIPAPFSMREW